MHNKQAKTIISKPIIIYIRNIASKTERGQNKYKVMEVKATENNRTPKPRLFFTFTVENF